MSKERKNVNLYLNDDMVQRINVYYEFGSFPNKTAAIWDIIEKGLSFDKEKKKYEDIINHLRKTNAKQENASLTLIGSLMDLLEVGGEMDEKQKNIYESLKVFMDMFIEKGPPESEVPPENPES